MALTDDQLAYLRSQRLGRLATVRPDGDVQNNPVGFWIDDQRRIVIGGHRLGQSQKYRNVRHHPQVAFVVDDLASVDPWRPRMVEIRGTAETLTDQETPPGFSGELIRITPARVIAVGV
ncbi:PPOX class F420-dependent oxidoreductase [Nocardioides sp. KR10-350]|uniref:PPOX class F420-dependent oxidoreductase n=1 Tax=Nocardioides cheoyonin TaxID=3156615 RepID=UPI0032B617DB